MENDNRHLTLDNLANFVTLSNNAHDKPTDSFIMASILVCLRVESSTERLAIIFIKIRCSKTFSDILKFFEDFSKHY